MTLRTATLTDHAARISRAVRHSSERLERTPFLEELAGVAAFSPCYFHRVYRALMGETPAETLTRLRLSRAAAALIRTGQTMSRIAREATARSPPSPAPSARPMASRPAPIATAPASAPSWSTR
ncbi:AraC family transcriptional regulator [Roseococcus sp. SYP-B2431]|uniref:helix-turn-helix domain-containing protein n=1 Tax=Roseococcus sp. SYP-B2431 TaxID=2496640 RepID=UPI00103D8808|nr:AraC family transcriptional regulator [Roseococcus sp. SYP-B2431]TCH96846.1 AraC family transcriptional regulator [Roseococcus sp. SYP-B2431]